MLRCGGRISGVPTTRFRRHNINVSNGSQHHHRDVTAADPRHCLLACCHCRCAAGGSLERRQPAIVVITATWVMRVSIIIVVYNSSCDIDTLNAAIVDVHVRCIALPSALHFSVVVAVINGFADVALIVVCVCVCARACVCVNIAMGFILDCTVDNARPGIARCR
jgi:hypothetical protein